MTNSSSSKERFRVTSIPFKTSNLVIFTGVPIREKSHKIASGKYYVSAKAKLDALPVEPAVGQHWEVSGIKKIKQIAVSDYSMQQHMYNFPDYACCDLPENGEQLIQFIAKEKDFKGIGEVAARALWNSLGKDFYSIAAKDSLENRKRLRGLLSENKIDSLFKGYAKYKNLAHCNWMSEHGIPANVQQRLIKYHGSESIEAIKQDPYMLLGFGLSFDEADKLAQGKLFQVSLNDSRRLSAAVESAIRSDISKGNTYSNQKSLRPKLEKLLQCKELATEAFKSGYRKAQYILNTETGNYHPTAQLLMESVVAKRLNTLTAKNNLFDSEAQIATNFSVEQLPYSLTDKQYEAVVTCLNNSVSCITGGAGTGKTTVLRTALRAYKRIGYQIHAVALSGRAAMRLKESIGFLTSTIAKLLRNPPIEPTEEQQNHLLVIDEASMIDLPTMYRLINHIHPSVRIIFTGDPNQLPPIGCGKVLADVVVAETIKNTMLDIVKRQEGTTGIPEYSCLINNGVVPEKLSTGAIFFHETTKEEIANVCSHLYQRDPTNSRVMAPTKALVKQVNELTQRSVNPYGKNMEFNLRGERFFMNLKKGDAILFTQNMYEKGVQNGSLGVLSKVHSTDENYGEVTLDTGEKIEVTQSLLDCMELGYAITLHKAQGSQFPKVIIALQKGKIVDRAWLYTAITRAESEVHIVGDSCTFESIVTQPSHSHKRRSFLNELLIAS
ncbi:AAA family ATPase [Pseudoalteromonas sp. H71]|uniref:AAA family ATPase n=1 Tax=Pseudoalteromonas sp. H71 TaxID=1348395 RepID=UPI00072FD792|nr:AAA family ATPase [Pseudoalteromonas sp. H71]KTD92227.1 AAA family ATPase [Pseudoalteromonas sp. H71]